MYNESDTTAFSFEKNFDQKEFSRWMDSRWKHSFVYSGLYVLVILGGQYYMKNRQKLELRLPLVLWSAILAVFSILGTIRTIPEVYRIIHRHGFLQSVCDPSFFTDDVTKFWAFLFALSKLYELGDTVFIVLRKQKLIFLHWYHHVTVFIYAWYTYTEQTAAGRWFMVMNYAVHSAMYTYYTLRACKVTVPKWVNMCITGMQICQMIMGITVNLVSYYIKSQGQYCHQSYENLACAFLMYASYLFLFVHFFYQTYLLPKPRTDDVNNSVAYTNLKKSQ